MHCRGQTLSFEQSRSEEGNGKFEFIGAAYSHHVVLLGEELRPSGSTARRVGNRPLSFVVLAWVWNIYLKILPEFNCYSWLYACTSTSEIFINAGIKMARIQQ